MAYATRPKQPLYMRADGGIFYGQKQVGQVDTESDGVIRLRYLNPMADLEEQSTARCVDNFAALLHELAHIQAQFDNDGEPGKFVPNPGGDGTEGGHKYTPPEKLRGQRENDPVGGE